jgi:hypothetical protein
MEKDSRGHYICPECYDIPEIPEEKLALAIFGCCIDCVPKEKLVSVSRAINQTIH